MDRLRDPKLRVRAALGLLVLCLIAWPISALTIFREEPQGILGLSWLAIILTCVDVIATTDVREEVEE